MTHREQQRRAKEIVLAMLRPGERLDHREFEFRFDTWAGRDLSRIEGASLKAALRELHEAGNIAFFGPLGREGVRRAR